MEQEAFQSEFAKLLGASGKSDGDYDNQGNAKQYKKSFAERDEEEYVQDLEFVLSSANISQVFEDIDWYGDMDNDEIKGKVIDKLAKEAGVKEFSEDYEKNSQSRTNLTNDAAAMIE